MNNDVKNFLSGSGKITYRRLLSGRGGVQPRDFFSAKHKKEFFGPYGLDSIYFFLVSSNFLLPHALNTLASKNI